MANYSEITKINPKRFVPLTSRYSDASVIYYTEKKFLTYSTYKKKSNKTTSKDKYYAITAGTQYRPDLVSQLAYGTVDLWWRIMEANNIKDIFDFKSGLTIRIPDNLFG